MKVGAFGLGGTGIILPPDTNLDTVNLGGLYRINTGGGIPAGFEYGSMLVIRAADTIAQLIVNHATGTIVSRGGSNLVDGQVPAFNPWVTSWNTSNFNPAAYQPNLGFTPVQQGTGHGQLGNIVKIGWGSDGQLRCTVDDLDLGVVWCQNNLDPALQAMPIGAPIAWPTPWPPVNYLPMMGQGFDVNLHPALAALYPGVLPDMRGEWIRGWDNGRGVDPGRNLLTFQGAVDNYLAEVKGTGSVPGVPEQGTIYVPNDGNYSASLFSGSTTGTQMSLQFKNSGGGEGRPRNMAFNIICRVY
ncbi:phage tail protein [Pseudomonas sp. Irchel s3b5]|uniref:phage tail protein n=1 Tax=Pseudomonas sp. Irchel s3b5 TaxID=2009077 RepID=UPI0035317511